MLNTVSVSFSLRNSDDPEMILNSPLYFPESPFLLEQMQWNLICLQRTFLDLLIPFFFITSKFYAVLKSEITSIKIFNQLFKNKQLYAYLFQLVATVLILWLC